MEEARKKKWASVALIIGQLFQVSTCKTDHYGIEKLKLGHFV